VTGDPETEKILGRASATLVTVPEPLPVAAIVIVFPTGVREIPDPAANTTAPDKPFRVVTPPLPSSLGNLTY
jgi:hypothetical protein